MAANDVLPLPAQRTYRHVAEALFGRPWAIEPQKLMALVEILSVRLDGFMFTLEAIEERLEAAGPRRPVQHSTGATAVIPIVGVIHKRGSMISDGSGGTSLDAIAAAFRSALVDERVKSIVLDIDSPGGATDGVEEFADEIHAARGRKPITAIANPWAASAAYWIGSAAPEFVVTPSGEVGSIGVFAVHHDQSAFDEAMGVRHTVVRAGRYKAEGLYEALSSEATAYLQEQVDAFYGRFVASVARGRGVAESAVREGYGEGRMVLARDAARMGMVDRVATLETVLARHAGRAASSPSAAEAEPAEMTAEERERAMDLFELGYRNYRHSRDGLADANHSEEVTE